VEAGKTLRLEVEAHKQADEDMAIFRMKDMQLVVLHDYPIPPSLCL